MLDMCVAYTNTCLICASFCTSPCSALYWHATNYSIAGATMLTSYILMCWCCTNYFKPRAYSNLVMGHYWTGVYSLPQTDPHIISYMNITYPTRLMCIVMLANISLRPKLFSIRFVLSLIRLEYGADLPIILILSVCTDFLPLECGNIQILFLKIWQNTDFFQECKSFFCIIIFFSHIDFFP